MDAGIFIILKNMAAGIFKSKLTQTSTDKVFEIWKPFYQIWYLRHSRFYTKPNQTWLLICLLICSNFLLNSNLAPKIFENINEICLDLDAEIFELLTQIESQPNQIIYNSKSWIFQQSSLIKFCIKSWVFQKINLIKWYSHLII